MDVAAWLKNLGLGQYEASFQDNAIEGDLLPTLTAEDLKDLGVTIVGHRRKLLDAIAALGAASKPTPGSAAADPPATLPPPAVSSRPQPRSGADAERRPITVMFCDLVGSTSMAAKLDAEDWRTLVNTYLDEASAAVTGLGGHVLKKLGDGLMALFGYPHAQENDAERAVRAALAIQRALVEINARNASKGAPELSARIGLDSGQVVVDATGEVFGDAPNIAARVQSAAEPGSILITATVQRQTAGLFVAEDRGQHELKGVSAPMTLYRIVRASGGGRRGGARALTPLVGREEELDLLTRRWERARKGEGQLALIVGEPGLGKSQADGGVSRPPRRDAAHLGRMVVVATVAEYAAASDRRMGPAALRRGPARRTAPGRPREHSGSDRPGPNRIRASARAAGRCPLARGPGSETRARGVAPPATGGDDGMDSGGRADASKSCSPSRTCTGPTRLRSISCARWPSAGRRRRCSSSRRRGRSSARPGACGRTIA